MNETKFTKNGNVLTLERVFNAPKDKVWEAYATPEIFEKWWGPKGWSTKVKEFDFNPGGSLLYGMTCEDQSQGEWYGKSSWGKAVFETVNPKDGFTYTDYFCDENGVATEGMPAAKIAVRFEETDGKTKLVTVTTYDSEAELDKVIAMGMEQGIAETYDKLEQFLQSS